MLMGSNLGDITNLANDYLPKSAIDRTTIRMAELLQHRMGRLWQFLLSKCNCYIFNWFRYIFYHHNINFTFNTCKMTATPIEQLASLRVGTVEFIFA